MGAEEGRQASESGTVDGVCFGIKQIVLKGLWQSHRICQLSTTWLMMTGVMIRNLKHLVCLWKSR